MFKTSALITESKMRQKHEKLEMMFPTMLFDFMFLIASCQSKNFELKWIPSEASLMSWLETLTA